ncbi:MAG: hypothetical protein IIY81_11230, partial [Lachnospiraceae bacterium]|nr:hypothetical protein [Lachnospiraceae bacterium]
KAIDDAKEMENYWNFFKRPQLAFSRGGDSGVGDIQSGNGEVYESQMSEYSFIERQDGKIKVILDSEVYNAQNLRVKYTHNGEVIIRNFDYDNESEAYYIEIDENDLDEGKIEIIEADRKM